MFSFVMGEEAPTQGILDQGASANTCAGRSSGLLAPVRYYFNLTDGDTMIRNEDGIVASSIQATVVSAMEAVEEFRAQDPSNSDEWQGWRLEIVDASGQAIQMMPLDAPSAH